MGLLRLFDSGTDANQPHQNRAIEIIVAEVVSDVTNANVAATGRRALSSIAKFIFNIENADS